MRILKQRNGGHYSLYIGLFLLIIFSELSKANFTKSNGIVRDSKTMLQWQDEYPKNFNIVKLTTWTKAIDYCESLILNKHDDWRLPNINELTSLVDDNKINPSINVVFKNSVSDIYWSSTTYLENSNYAFQVNFQYGSQYISPKSNNRYVRCVRDGQ